jgi:uncharacterized protein YaaW (UPF0174 family)
MEMVQFINSKLYGRYYPVMESEEYLKEHGEYFRQKVKNEIVFIQDYAYSYEHNECRNWLKPERFLFFPLKRNKLQNKQTMVRIQKKLESIEQQKQVLEDILSKPLSEITTEEINYFYELRYKRRKTLLIKSLLFVLISVVIIIFCIKNQLL